MVEYIDLKVQIEELCKANSIQYHFKLEPNDSLHRSFLFNLSAEYYYLNKLKKLSASKQHYSKLKAAFFTSKLWPNNQELKISFLEKGTR